MKLKRKLSGFLSMVVCVSLLGTTPSYAAGKTVEAEIPEASNVDVAFCDNDNDGIYEPSYVFELTDGSSYQVNSLTGECLSND